MNLIDIIEKIYKKQKKRSYDKKYNRGHKKEKKKLNEKYQANTKVKRRIKTYQSKYYQEHKEQIDKQTKKYRETTKGKATIKRHSQKINHKRRSLGFVPLNDWFENSAGHHIDKAHVIYIPKEIHQSIRHNVWTGERMYEINAIAFDYLLT